MNKYCKVGVAVGLTMIGMGLFVMPILSLLASVIFQSVGLVIFAISMFVEMHRLTNLYEVK